MIAWACTGCGACCRSVDLLRVQAPELELDSGDGVCRHLERDTNQCAIFETRPQICRTSAVHTSAYLRSNCERVHLRVFGSPWRPEETTDAHR